MRTHRSLDLFTTTLQLWLYYAIVGRVSPVSVRPDQFQGTYKRHATALHLILMLKFYFVHHLVFLLRSTKYDSGVDRFQQHAIVQRFLNIATVK